MCEDLHVLHVKVTHWFDKYRSKIISYKLWIWHLTGLFLKTLPMLLRLLSSKAQWPKDFWKPSKHCHVGIHWIALAEYYQISTHVPGSLFKFFCIILCWPNKPPAAKGLTDHHYVFFRLRLSSWCKTVFFCVSTSHKRSLLQWMRPWQASTELTFLSTVSKI